jgi:hypothetical protein
LGLVFAANGFLPSVFHQFITQPISTAGNGIHHGKLQRRHSDPMAANIGSQDLKSPRGLSMEMPRSSLGMTIGA